MSIGLYGINYLKGEDLNLGGLLRFDVRKYQTDFVI